MITLMWDSTESKRAEEIVKQNVDKYPGDCPEGIRKSIQSIKRMKNFEKLIDYLLNFAVTQKFYDRRCRINWQIKNDIGAYDTTPKVDTTDSESVQDVNAVGIFMYHINGCTLGDMFGEDLIPKAESEERIGSGHFFNAILLRALVGHVPDDKQVKEAISEKKVLNIYKKLKSQKTA